MSILREKRGTWINQYATPPPDLFVHRAGQVDYVIIKYGLKEYEKLAHQSGIPWLAERMGESGTGDQRGPSRAVTYGTELANQANQPGCVGAVVNLEESDGGWHTDDGGGTRELIDTFRKLAPGKPLFASLDTRGNRPNSPYQRALAAACEGVMPMVYPAAFGQRADVAFAAAITPLVRASWNGKEIIPTFQTYDKADVPSQVAELDKLYRAGTIDGANSYTLGHATDAQWDASIAFSPAGQRPQPSQPDVAPALKTVRALWIDTWHAIEQKGTVSEATALAEFWRNLSGS